MVLHVGDGPKHGATRPPALPMPPQDTLGIAQSLQDIAVKDAINAGTP